MTAGGAGGGWSWKQESGALQWGAVGVERLEPRVRRKRFSALGAASFDADVRALTAFFGRRSSRLGRVRQRAVAPRARLGQTRRRLRVQQ